MTSARGGLHDDREARVDSVVTAPSTEHFDPGPELTPRRWPLAKLVERLGLVGAWIITVGLFGGLKPSVFLTPANFEGIFGSQVTLVILALALLVPLTAGDYDLSVAGILSLSAMMLAVLNAEHHMALTVVLPACLGMGAVVGAINGVIAVGLGIDTFIVTLGTGTVLSGVVLWISGSNTIAGISDRLVNVIAVDRFLGIPLAFYYGLGICILLWYFLEFTAIGRRMLFVGRGRTVAKLSGVHVGRLRCGALIASGTLSAGAGIVYAGSSGAADPTSGSSFLLAAFAAAFLGATSIVPGRFNPWGTFIAVYFLATGITGLAFYGVESFVQDLFYGGALVAAVALAQLAKRGEELAE